MVHVHVQCTCTEEAFDEKVAYCVSVLEEQLVICSSRLTYPTVNLMQNL